MSRLSPPALQRPEPVQLDQRITWSYIELSQATGLSVPTLRGLTHQGLPHIRIGDRVLFVPGAALAFFVSRLVTHSADDAPPAVDDGADE